jgi:hypothetical protein
MDGLRKSLGDILQALGQSADLLCNGGEGRGDLSKPTYLWKNGL